MEIVSRMCYMYTFEARNEKETVHGLNLCLGLFNNRMEKSREKKKRCQSIVTKQNAEKKYSLYFFASVWPNFFTLAWFRFLFCLSMHLLPFTSVINHFVCRSQRLFSRAVKSIVTWNVLSVV